MKVLQKILSHGLLIAFVVAAFLLYMNRTELFPNGFDDNKTVQAPVKALPGEPEKAVEQAVTEPESDSLQSSGEEQVQPAEVSQPDEAEVSSVPDAAVSEVAVEQASRPAPEPQTGAPQAESTPMPEPATVAAVADDREVLQRRLDEARKLYWKHDIRAAEAAYEALGRDYPDSSDVWGEIGNFYFSTRQSHPAAMAYYRTVSLLIDKGDTHKARQLLGVLYRLDANRGRELDARLQQSEK